MDKDIVTHSYKNFRSCIRKMYHNTADTNTIRELNSLVGDDLPLVLEGFLLHKLRNNAIGKQHKNKQIVSFLASAKSVKKSLVPIFLLTDIKSRLNDTLKNAINDIPNLNKETYNQSSIFKVSIALEQYKEETLLYLFYYKHDDNDTCAHYVQIYQDYIIGTLLEIYQKTSVNRQINLDNMQICSLDNFKEINALDIIAFGNRDKLVNRLINGVHEGRRLLSEDHIIACYKAEIIHDMIKYSLKYKDQVVPKPKDPHASLTENIDKEIKITITRLLKGSMTQDKYSIFFTKEDYINFLCDKYVTFAKDHIEKLFNSVTMPAPPIGVTRFTISNPIRGDIVYFVALDKVAEIFENYSATKQSKSQDINLLTISEGHFMSFLRKLLKDFNKLGYSKDVILDKLQCSRQTLENIEKAIAN